MTEKKGPLVVSYGMGVDSTAVLVGYVQQGIRPDAILFADTGSEKPETYAYLATMNEFLRKHDFPEVTVLQYQASDFKNWPAYHTLLENCLTNGTLPSEAFGYGSCSIKWKHVPQNKWTEAWGPAKAAWDQGLQVRKAIGFDCGEKSRTYKADVSTKKSDKEKYAFEYPLQEWGWHRVRCVAEIQKAGLPVPPKSSCFFCPNMTVPEIDELPKFLLQQIVVIEARASVRLEGHLPQGELDKINQEATGYASEKALMADYEAAKLRYRAKLKIWRRAVKTAKEMGIAKMPAKPAKEKGWEKKPRWKKVGDPNLIRGLWRGKLITNYIREKGLLPASEIERLWNVVPKEIVRRNEAKAKGFEVESWVDFFERVGVSA